MDTTHSAMNAPTPIAWVGQIALALPDGAPRTRLLICSDCGKRPSCPARTEVAFVGAKPLPLQSWPFQNAVQVLGVSGHVGGPDGLLFLDEEATSPSLRHSSPAWRADRQRCRQTVALRCAEGTLRSLDGQAESLGGLRLHLQWAPLAQS